MTPGKGTQKDVTSPPQWDGLFYVHNALDLRSLSLDGVENQNKKWNSKGVHKKKDKKNMTMMEDQSQTKSIDPE